MEATRPPLLRTATLIEQVPPVQAPVPGVSFSGYIELVENMRRQAEHARRHGDDERQFVVLYALVLLLVHTLPRHPEFRTRDHAVRRQLLCDLARQHLTELEELKARIDAA